jgi:hypothetical protein
MREGTTSRVMAVDIPYGELYDFYSVSREYFGYTIVHARTVPILIVPGWVYSFLNCSM